MPLTEPEGEELDSDVSADLTRLRLRLSGMADRVAALKQRLLSGSASIVALDRLAHVRAPETARPVSERWEAEAAQLPSEAWEISLISEEG
jgi:hypothetical protein